MDTSIQAADDAVDNARTGAMLALVPTEADAQRLALEGGLPAEELHVTLVFLGKSEDWSPEMQAEVHQAAASFEEGPILEGVVWATADFNPMSEDAVAVYLIGDDSGSMAAFQQAVAESLTPVEDMVPNQHSPWVPHLSIQYADDLSTVTEQMTEFGPVTFDRLRVAFGEDVVDHPLTGTAVEPMPMEDEAITAEVPCPCEDIDFEDMTAEEVEGLIEMAESLVATVIGDLDLPVLQDRNRDWDGPAAASRIFEWAGGEEFDPSRAARGFLYRDPDADPATRGAYKLPMADVVDGDLRIIPRGVFTLSGGRGVGAVEGVSAEERSQLESRVCTLYGKVANALNDDEIQCPFEESSSATASEHRCEDIEDEDERADCMMKDLYGISTSLAAAVDAHSIVAQAVTNTPQNPPTEWFEPVPMKEAMPITVTADGRVFGTLAKFGTCHRGIEKVEGKCVTPPRSLIDYAAFNSTVSVTAEDGSDISTGSLYVGCDHAPLDVGYEQSLENLQNRCTRAAVVRAYDDEHGIHVAGALTPGLSVEQVNMLANLSGEWRRLEMELSAAVGVENPAYPVGEIASEVNAVEAMTASEKLAVAMVAHIPRIPDEEPVTVSSVASAVADELERREQERKDEQATLAAISAAANAAYSATVTRAERLIKTSQDRRNARL